MGKTFLQLQFSEATRLNKRFQCQKGMLPTSRYSGKVECSEVPIQFVHLTPSTWKPGCEKNAHGVNRNLTVIDRRWEYLHFWSALQICQQENQVDPLNCFHYDYFHLLESCQHCIAVGLSLWQYDLVSEMKKIIQ